MLRRLARIEQNQQEILKIVSDRSTGFKNADEPEEQDFSLLPVLPLENEEAINELENSLNDPMLFDLLVSLGFLFKTFGR